MEQYCSATAIIVNINDPMKIIKIRSGGHNHGPSIQDMAMPHLRKSVGRRAIALGAMTSSIRNIYNEEIIK